MSGREIKVKNLRQQQADLKKRIPHGIRGIKPPSKLVSAKILKPNLDDSMRLKTSKKKYGF